MLGFLLGPLARDAVESAKSPVLVLVLVAVAGVPRAFHLERLEGLTG